MDDHETRSITLSPELAATVDAAVEGGGYASASAVVDEALREWAERRDNFGYTIEELRALVQEGLDSGPGQYDSMDEIKAAARSQFEERRLATKPDGRAADPHQCARRAGPDRYLDAGRLGQCACSRPAPGQNPAKLATPLRVSALRGGLEQFFARPALRQIWSLSELLPVFAGEVVILRVLHGKRSIISDDIPIQ